VLRYEAEITDPSTFTRPWKMSMNLYKHAGEDARLQQFKCVEFVEELLYGAYRNELVRRQLQEQIVALSGRGTLEIYLAYNILAQLDWSIHHHSRTAVMEGVALAQTILEDREHR